MTPEKETYLTSVRIPASLWAELRVLRAETHLSLNESVLLALRGMLDLVAAPAGEPAAMPKLVVLGRAARSASGQSLGLMPPTLSQQVEALGVNSGVPITPTQGAD